MFDGRLGLALFLLGSHSSPWFHVELLFQNVPGALKWILDIGYPILWIVRKGVLPPTLMSLLGVAATLCTLLGFF